LNVTLLPPIVAESTEQAEWVDAVASKYGLTVCSCGLPDSGFVLFQTPRRLELRQIGHKAPGPIYVDFVGGKSAHRRQYGGGRKQPLARAVGLKKAPYPSILDVTAGMGKDAFVLATLGCQVTMIERSPVIAALLADGLMRATKSPEVNDIARRMTLLHCDAIGFMQSQGCQPIPDVIYMDPMYPHRKKSAQVKKEMYLFRQLVGDDLDSEALHQAAMQVAKKRVVVKRPAKSMPISEIKVDASSNSPNTRYDLYFMEAREDAAELS